VMSHAAADAITLLRLVKEMAGHYHALVKGEVLGIDDAQRAASVELKRPLRRRTSAWSDYAATCKHALVPFSSTTLPQGTGWINDHTEHHVKRILSKEETREVFNTASGMRIFVVDYLLACGFQTIKLWNQSLGVVSSSVAAALTVNLNGRVNSPSCGNNDSVLYFRWQSEPRTDLAKLGKTILRSRVRQFREGMDFKYARGMEKLNNALRVLPYPLKGRLYRSVLQKHQTSFALGYFGVLWPRADGDAGTGESYLQSMGDMEITEVHGLAYKIFSRTPLYLSAYIFREQLNVVLSAAGWLFTSSESAAFMKLLVNTIREGDVGH